MIEVMEGKSVCERLVCDYCKRVWDNGEGVISMFVIGVCEIIAA